MGRGVAACLVVLAVACGGNEKGGNCIPGETKTCTCAGGVSGTARCRDDGSLGPCWCAMVADADTASPPPVHDAVGANDLVEGPSDSLVEGESDHGAQVPSDPGEDAVDGANCLGPMDWTCTTATHRVRCVEGQLVEEDCAEGTACVMGTCKEVICDPGAKKCAGPDTYQECIDEGTAWSDPKPCPGGVGKYPPFCESHTGQCMCQLPVNVLFVLDASGSMELLEPQPGLTQWDVAVQAISEIMDTYSFMSFGLATFPDQTVHCGLDACPDQGGCSKVGSVNIDLGQDNIQAIKDYLAQRKLAEDPKNLIYVLTPLKAMFDYLVEGYPEDGPLKKHELPSYVVLLSDGEDSCYSPKKPEAVIGPVAKRAQELLELYGVKTFVIGFNLEDGQDQLDAIAMHGGTGLAHHVPANDLPSLLASLQQVFESMEIRNCQEFEDTPVPPGCTDADNDSWCDFLDCNDSDPWVNYWATEMQGDQKDDDCDGQTDEPPDKYQDQDNDGFTPAQGDCDDFDKDVNPGAVEVVGDGVDNDCDGEVDEGGGCECMPATGQSYEAMACAAEISCAPNTLLGQQVSSLTGDDLSLGWTAVNHFGNPGNDLAPKAGPSYALLATGPALGTQHSTDLPGGGQWTDPYSKSDPAYDVVEWRLTLKAPQKATGFSVDYVFFSEEYDEFIGSIFNDKFYIILNAPQTTGGQNQVINFTDCRDPNSYYDVGLPGCPLPSGYCCYVAINTALSECCWYQGCPNGKASTDISGTGFECAPSQEQDWYNTGSSTGWLKTTWSIEGGEVFTLTFHLHDTGDGIFDSEVIIDHFQWHYGSVTPGTEPVD